MRSEPSSAQPPAYYLRRALDSILAVPAVTGVTVISIAVSILLAGAVLLVGSNAYRLVEHWGSQGVDVSVYLRPGITDAEVVALKDRISTESGVAEVVYISQEEAWQFLADNLGDSAELLDGLDPSVLPASLEVALFRSLDDQTLKATLESWSALAEVDDVQYNRVWSERLESARNLVRWLTWALGAMALACSAIVVVATFRLAAASRSDEMEVLRLVGAVGPSYWGPSVLAGFIEGAAGSMAALMLLVLVFRLVASPAAAALPVLSETLAFLTVGQWLVLLVWGSVLGGGGSWLGVQRMAPWR